MVHPRWTLHARDRNARPFSPWVAGHLSVGLFSRAVANRLLAALIAAALASPACAPSRSTPAPAADLLVATSDSSFWVTSDPRGLRMRGVPMLLARVDGRFEELYVTDDDRSYFDAVFVGQRLFRRDLIRGDSVELLADSLVPRMARDYAKANPHESRLMPGEDASDHPGTTATADLEILGVFGPYLAYEYRTDVDATGARGVADTDRHTARRGVLDLRTGKPTTLGALIGRAAADRAIASASAEWETARDSLLNRSDEGSRRAQRTVVAFAFDPSSFTIEAAEREPQIVFAVPGAVSGGNAGALELSAQPVSAPLWWGLARDDFPAGPDSARSWAQTARPGRAGQGRVELTARVTGDAERAVLALSDQTRRSWPVGSVTAPVQRVMWLDSTVTAETKKALHRAFNEAAQYSDDIRVAALPANSYFFVVNNAFAQTRVPHRSRIAERYLGVDDADRRERPRPRVRRRNPRDDGQDGRRLRHPPLALDLRDCVGRSRGLPPADSRRRAGAHAGERELRGPVVHGDRHPDRSGEHAHGRATAHQLMLHDLRRNR
jgi:hypothetical protein